MGTIPVKLLKEKEFHKNIQSSHNEKLSKLQKQIVDLNKIKEKDKKSYIASKKEILEKVLNSFTEFNNKSVLKQKEAIEGFSKRLFSTVEKCRNIIKKRIDNDKSNNSELDKKLNNEIDLLKKENDKLKTQAAQISVVKQENDKLLKQIRDLKKQGTAENQAKSPAVASAKDKEPIQELNEQTNKNSKDLANTTKLLTAAQNKILTISKAIGKYREIIEKKIFTIKTKMKELVQTISQAKVNNCPMLVAAFKKRYAEITKGEDKETAIKLLKEEFKKKLESNAPYAEMVEKCKQQESEIGNLETQLNSMLVKISDLEEENAELAKQKQSSKAYYSNLIYLIR